MRWIKCKNRLPELYTDVLMFFDNGNEQNMAVGFLADVDEHMVLDNEQARQLADYAVKKEVYNWDGVESVVATALAHGNKVVINADW